DGFVGLDFDEKGDPVATKNKVFTNEGKGKYARWIIRILGLEPSQIFVKYDGETDGPMTYVVANSQMFYAPEHPEAIDQRDKAWEARHRTYEDGRDRVHPRPVATHYYQEADLYDWVRWAEQLNIDYLMEHNELLHEDIESVPRDAEGRQAVL